MVVVEHLDQPLQLLRLDRIAHQPADVLHVPAGPQQRQLLPAGEGGEVAVGDRQDVVERLVQAALAQLRRHQMVDDPVVEGVAGHADPRVGQRLRAHATVPVAEAHQREVAGAPAEVADQHRGVALQPPGEEEGRRDRLVDVADVLKPQPFERRLVARQGQGRVRAQPRERHRPPDDHPFGQVSQIGAAMLAHLQQEGAQQVLEGEPPPQDLGVGEQGRGGVALERLDEPRLQRLLDIGVDRPRPGLDHAAGRVVVGCVETQGRAEGVERLAVMIEAGEARLAPALVEGDDRVGRAEINADRGVGYARHGMSLRGKWSGARHPGEGAGVRLGGCFSSRRCSS